MTSDPSLLLHQWLSPSFPVGAFSYSHGLETAVAEGQITDAETAQGWIATALEFGAGQSDAILVAAAWRSDSADLDDLTALTRSAGEVAEVLRSGYLWKGRTLRPAMVRTRD